MNIWDIIIVLVIALVVFRAVRSIMKNKGSACSCGCQDCPSSSACRRAEKDN